MNQTNQTPNKVDGSCDNWRLYELLWGIIQHNHYRWIHNYRVFLSFNALLLPAVTALLGYIIKGKVCSLIPLVLLICFAGIFITMQGLGLIKRIDIDTKMRFSQLNRTETTIPDMILNVSQEGKLFFLEGRDIPDFYQKDYPCKGKPATEAYKNSSIMIIVCYVIVITYGILYLLFLLNRGQCILPI